MSVFKGILKKNPRNSSARAALASLYSEKGKWKVAYKLAKEVLVLDPKSISAHRTLALYYLQSKKYDMAKLMSLRGLKLDKNDPTLVNNLGLIMLKEGDDASAMAQFWKAVELNEKNTLAWMNIATISLRYDDFATALEAYNKVLAEDPNNVMAHIGLGAVFRGQKNYDEAMAQYQEALKLDPKNLLPILNMGVLHHKGKKDPAKALEFYKKFTRIARISGKHKVHRLIKEAEKLKIDLATKQEEERKTAAEKAFKEKRDAIMEPWLEPMVVQVRDTLIEEKAKSLAGTVARAEAMAAADKVSPKKKGEPSTPARRAAEKAALVKAKEAAVFYIGKQFHELDDELKISAITQAREAAYKAAENRMQDAAKLAAEKNLKTLFTQLEQAVDLDAARKQSFDSAVAAAEASQGEFQWPDEKPGTPTDQASDTKKAADEPVPDMPEASEAKKAEEPKETKEPEAFEPDTEEEAEEAAPPPPPKKKKSRKKKAKKKAASDLGDML